MTFKAVLCPCGWIQVTGAANRYKCLKCGRSRALYRKGMHMGILREFDNPLDASDFVKAWKKDRAKHQGIAIRKGGNYTNLKKEADHV